MNQANVKNETVDKVGEGWVDIKSTPEEKIREKWEPLRLQLL